MGDLNKKVNEVLFLPLSNKVLVLPQKFDHILIFYEHGTEILQALLSFLRNGYKNNELCLVVCDERSISYFKREFKEDSNRLHIFPIVWKRKSLFREMSNLNAKLQKLYNLASQKYSGLRIVMDFGGLGNYYVIKDLIDLLRNIILRKNEKMSFTVKSIVAFEINVLPHSLVNSLLEFYENIVFFLKSGYMVLGLTFRSLKKTNSIVVDTIPRKMLERFVKKNLELIILSLILKKPMCGYELIRKIYQEYYVFLSQGTVYPMLYSMKKSGLLKIINTKNPRAKVYALTEKGKEETRSKINDFLKVLKYMIELFEKTD